MLSYCDLFKVLGDSYPTRLSAEILGPGGPKLWRDLLSRHNNDEEKSIDEFKKFLDEKYKAHHVEITRLAEEMPATRKEIDSLTDNVNSLTTKIDSIQTALNMLQTDLRNNKKLEYQITAAEMSLEVLNEKFAVFHDTSEYMKVMVQSLNDNIHAGAKSVVSTRMGSQERREMAIKSKAKDFIPK